MAVTVLEQQKVVEFVEFVSGNEVPEPASASVIMDSMVATEAELAMLRNLSESAASGCLPGRSVRR